MTLLHSTETPAAARPDILGPRRLGRVLRIGALAALIAAPLGSMLPAAQAAAGTDAQAAAQQSKPAAEGATPKATPAPGGSAIPSCPG